MKVYLNNTGTCTRVKLYGNDVESLLKENNCEFVNLEDADYIFINTCSFLESKSSYFLNKLKEINKNLKKKQTLCVIGCLGGTHKKEIEEISKDIIIFKRDITEIKDYFNFKNNIKTKSTSVEDTLPTDKKIIYIFNKLILHSKHIEYRLKRDKVCYLQISSGCRGKCTYCSEKFITKLKSRPINEIMSAINDGIERGYTLFGLNSDDASCYGKDIDTNLETLLEEVVKIDKDIYFSIPEFNPNGLTDKVVELLKDKKFLYITVPIQSGSNRILNLMQRPYEIEEVVEKIKNIKKNNKNLRINTHVIVGFPGETEEDFNKTKELLETGLFDRVKVFMYNDRPNTVASKMDNKITKEIKEKRKNELLSVIKKQNLKHFSITNLILNREQLK